MSNTELRSTTSRENVSCTDPIVIDDWLHRVRGEYLEMPGLRLTLAQAARFWCLDHPTCACLLDALVNARFLIVTSDGLYTRAQGHAAEHLRLEEARELKAPWKNGDRIRANANGERCAKTTAPTEMRAGIAWHG